MSKPLVCIKLGGRVAADESVLESFAGELGHLGDRSHFVLVHGGGAEVSRISRLFNLEPEFKDGVRMTSEAEMEVVDMVLAGKVNKHLVRALYRRGLTAVGISATDGALVIGEPFDGTTRTGRPLKVNPSLVNSLTSANFLPVISPVAMGADGTALNINADEVALALAAAIPAESLIFISDIPGIMRQGQAISSLTPEQSEAEIEAGVISGGMIPKVRASAGALRSGVSRVVIGGYAMKGDLNSLLSGESGTTMYQEENRT